jgi:cyclohexanecarboxylate-CoA ligase
VPGTLADALRGVVAASPEAVAVVDGPVRLTYAELDERVRRAAAVLDTLGVRPGDVVAWQLPNWWEAVVLHHAIVALGGVSNPLMPILRERELTFMLRQSGARVLVVPERFRRFDHAALGAALRERVATLEHVLVVRPAAPRADDLGALLAAASPGAAPLHAGADGDRVLLLYTSGTESVPKGALHSHATLAAEIASIRDLYALGERDVVFMPSPIGHITGVLYGLHLPVLLRSAGVLQDVWEPGRALALIERERCSFQVGATPFLHALTHHEELPDHEIGSLRVFVCGGADVSPALARLAAQRLGCCVVRTYGSTEMPTVTAGRLDDPPAARADTDGRAIGAAQVRVVDDDGRPVRPGAPGNVEARGPELFLGYLDPGLTAAAMTPDGWFRTGDLAVLDDGGHLTIRGRAKDIIIRGGENISVKEVEDVLLEHPAIADVAVVAMPDPLMGEKGCAFVVLAGGAALELAELVAHLDGQGIARQKFPEHLEVVDELPRTASGKVKKFELRERAAALRAGPVVAT